MNENIIDQLLEVADVIGRLTNKALEEVFLKDNKYNKLPLDEGKTKYVEAANLTAIVDELRYPATLLLTKKSPLWAYPIMNELKKAIEQEKKLLLKKEKLSDKEIKKLKEGIPKTFKNWSRGFVHYRQLNEEDQDKVKSIYWSKVGKEFENYKRSFQLKYDNSEVKEVLVRSEIELYEKIFDIDEYKPGIIQNERPFKQSILTNADISGIRRLYQKNIVEGNRDYSITQSENNPIRIGAADFHQIRFEAIWMYYKWLEKQVPQQQSGLSNLNKLIWAYEAFAINCDVKDISKERINELCDKMYEDEIYNVAHRAKQEIKTQALSTNNLNVLINLVKNDCTPILQQLEDIVKKHDLDHVDKMPDFFLFFRIRDILIEFWNWFQENIVVDRLNLAYQDTSGGSFKGDTNRKDVKDSKVSILIEKLNNYGFMTFLDSKNIDHRKVNQLLKRYSGKELMPFTIALLSEIGYLDSFEKQNKTKNEGFKKLSNVFDVSERRIKGNVNILRPNSKEDPMQYTSISYIEMAKKELKGL